MEVEEDPMPKEGDEVPTKKVRHRKKQFLQTIRKQMEFYFSDANLTKNRFMGQLVSKDPNVDLSLFLTFNKVRALTTDLDDIVKALKRSEVLSLTEDRTKVFRKTPICEKGNDDECTIYVEQLPPDADHEWLKNVFLPYGNVPYVSIPKYSHNGLNKGFAFVEFDTPESATKALEAFGAMGCRLTSEIMPEQICSNAITHQNIPIDETPDVGNETNYKVFAEHFEIESEAENLLKKRKKSKQIDSIEDCSKNEDVESDTKTAKKRKIKFEDDDEQVEKNVNVDKEKRSKRSKVETEQQDTEETGPEKTKINEESDDLERAAQSEKKPHLKRKKVAIEIVEGKEVRLDEHLKDQVTSSYVAPETETKPPKRSKRREGQDEEGEPEEPELDEEIIEEHHPKKRRHESRGELITEEPSGMDSKDEEKENDEARKRRRSRHHKKKGKKEKMEPDPKSSLRVLSKLEWKRLRNKYLNLQKLRMRQLKQHLNRSRWGNNSQDYYHHGYSSQEYSGNDNQRQQKESDTEKAAKKSEKKFTFTPGVIIHVRLPEPPADLKKFKNDAKAHPEVKYIDAMEGWNEAYIRCATAEAASQMVTQKIWSQMDIITGVEETAYWEKMDRDREVKCSHNERAKTRGKAKLLAKAEKAAGKHIRFTTEEDTGAKS